MAVEPREDDMVRWMTLAMAGFATAALEQAVLEPGRSRAGALAATAGLLLAPVLVAARALARRQRSAIGGAFPHRTGASPTAIVVLLTLFILPFGWEAGQRVFTGRSAMAEVILLSALRNLGLGLAAMACWPVYAKLSAIVSLFLLTVASSVGGAAGTAVLAPVGGFTVVGTLWLMLVYWKRVVPGFGARPAAQRLPISGLLPALGVVAVIAAVVAVGPSRAATALAGLVPTSGGTDWSDPEARSGVGDGDNEVSASEHPKSVGFTESEVYLETDRPSLYDAFNESYGEPFKPKRLEKMVALGQQDVGEQKERPSENLQAGREFSAVRRKPEVRFQRPGERAAKALVYVKGPTPLHLPLISYSHFNGVAWREEPCCNRHLFAGTEPRGTWIRLPSPEVSWLAGVVAHQVKIGTLESSPLPVPPHLTRFRVGSVNRLDFFGWAQYGIIRMTDRTVPAGTVIDCEARTVDREQLRSCWLPARPLNTEDHNLWFGSEYVISPTVDALARAWVEDLPEGWCQVEAVIATLRNEYAHDRSATAPRDCTDVVDEFLLRSHRGADYLFASAAAVLLRSLGYPTRVVSGLYAAPDRYDPLTRHTPVTREDVHFWSEVRLPNGLWIAVEPTPGYELMGPARPWSEWIAQALWAVAGWARTHAAGLLAALGVLGGVIVRRREVFDHLLTVAFWLRTDREPRLMVLNTLKLIERRAGLAGRPRPPWLTLARWYQPVARQGAGEPGAALEGLIRLADWASYAPHRRGCPHR